MLKEDRKYLKNMLEENLNGLSDFKYLQARKNYYYFTAEQNLWNETVLVRVHQSNFVVDHQYKRFGNDEWQELSTHGGINKMNDAELVVLSDTLYDFAGILESEMANDQHWQHFYNRVDRFNGVVVSEFTNGSFSNMAEKVLSETLDELYEYMNQTPTQVPPQSVRTEYAELMRQLARMCEKEVG